MLTGNGIECNRCCAEEKQHEVDVNKPLFLVHSSKVLRRDDDSIDSASSHSESPKKVDAKDGMAPCSGAPVTAPTHNTPKFGTAAAYTEKSRDPLWCEFSTWKNGGSLGFEAGTVQPLASLAGWLDPCAIAKYRCDLLLLPRDRRDNLDRPSNFAGILQKQRFATWLVPCGVAHYWPNTSLEFRKPTANGE